MAKTNPTLTAELLRSLLTYLPETGEFHNRTGRTVGHTQKNGYRIIGVNGKKYLAHRLAYLWMTGGWPSGDIDHIDRDPSNNQWTNLRDVSRSENAHNNAAAGYYFDRSKGKYRAQITSRCRVKHIGLFSTESEARAAYLSAKAAHLPGPS